MSFRTKLSLIFVLTVVGAVCVVAYGVTHYTQAAFDEMDAQRTTAIVAQFKKEFTQSGETVAQQVKNAADSDLTLRAAIDLARPSADQSALFLFPNRSRHHYNHLSINTLRIPETGRSATLGIQTTYSLFPKHRGIPLKGRTPSEDFLL